MNRNTQESSIHRNNHWALMTLWNNSFGILESSQTLAKSRGETDEKIVKFWWLSVSCSSYHPASPSNMAGSEWELSALCLVQVAGAVVGNKDLAFWNLEILCFDCWSLLLISEEPAQKSATVLTPKGWNGFSTPRGSEKTVHHSVSFVFCFHSSKVIF